MSVNIFSIFGSFAMHHRALDMYIRMRVCVGMCKVPLGFLSKLRLGEVHEAPLGSFQRMLHLGRFL